jgi:carbamoyltransferase
LLGFAAGADEHKVQWLSTADDGKAYRPLFEQILGTAGWPILNRAYFDSNRLSQGGFSEKFYRQIGLEDGVEIPQPMHAPLAAGLQRAIEHVVLRMAGPGDKLCLAGGLALNALLISSLEESKKVFVQPAAGNTGTALGAVFYAWNSVLGQKKRATLNDLCLGPSYDGEEIKKVLENCKLRFRYLLTTGELIDSAVRDLNAEKIIAWMQGRMEFGPRALGNRSLLADPRRPDMRNILNQKVKHREDFRPFAPSVMAEHADEWFAVGAHSASHEFMLFAPEVKVERRARIPAVVHQDGTARVQLVSRELNPRFHELLTCFFEKTGVPMVVNTSFNDSEPIVCTPTDAIVTFRKSGIDALVMEDVILTA